MGQTGREFARRFMGRMFTEHDVDAADEIFTPGYVEHDPWAGHTGDLEGFKAGLRGFISAFPDLRCDVLDVIEEGDRVAIRSVITGTHRGAFAGAAPTGRRVHFHSMDMVRLENGRCVEHWGVVDAATMIAQLGMLPEP